MVGIDGYEHTSVGRKPDTRVVMAIVHCTFQKYVEELHGIGSGIWYEHEYTSFDASLKWRKECKHTHVEFMLLIHGLEAWEVNVVMMDVYIQGLRKAGEAC